MLLGRHGRVSKVAVVGRVHGWVRVGAVVGSVLRHAVGSCCCVLCSLVLTLLLMLLGVDALVLLEVLWTLEGLSTDVAVVRLEWCVNTNVRCDVIALGTGDVTAFPLASKAEVVGGLTTDVVVAEMLVDDLGIEEHLATVVPSAVDGFGRCLKLSTIRCVAIPLDGWGW